MWIKLEDNFSDHPKHMAAGVLASWLWVCGLTYCARYLTDGRIPKVAVRSLARLEDPMAEAQRLVDVGLWIDDGDSFSTRNYLRFQCSASQVKEKRKRDAKRASKRRTKKVAPISPEFLANSHAVTHDGLPSDFCASPERVRSESQDKTKTKTKTKSKKRSEFSDLSVLSETSSLREPQDPPTPPQRPGEGSATLWPDVIGPSLGEAKKDQAQVWEHWLAHWTRVVGKGRAPTLLPARAKTIAARLKDLDLATLLRAADGIWTHPWSLEDPGARISFEICYRNGAQVERYAAMAPAPRSNVRPLRAPIPEERFDQGEPCPLHLMPPDLRAKYEALEAASGPAVGPSAPDMMTDGISGRPHGTGTA